MDAAEIVYRFYDSYKGEKFIYGRSECGLPLVGIFIGRHNEYPLILAQYAIHAREWITSLLALEHAKRSLAAGGAYILPLVNPDGVKLAQNGKIFLEKLPAAQRELLSKANGGSNDFSLWKANARAVDLNVNFNADWGTGKANVYRPSSQNYVGEFPESEAETRALCRLTRRILPNATISFHTKGGEIYWEYGQVGEDYLRDSRIAERLARSAGYQAKKICGSVGGYKDWCIQSLHLPSFTVEAGSESFSHPLTERELPFLIKDCGNMLIRLSEIMRYER